MGQIKGQPIPTCASNKALRKANTSSAILQSQDTHFTSRDLMFCISLGHRGIGGS